MPAAHRTSSPVDQFWIWTGANIAPINWVLGALGIQLGLSLLQTLAVVVIGNLFGAALFAAFCLMGHRTGVPQMVLGRLAFGLRGAYLPALAQVLMPMGWVAINTWIVLDLCMAALERMGFSGGPEVKYMVAALVMVLQVGIAAWGFNAIKVFERYTMPLILFIMAVMTALAFLRVDIKWQSPTVGGMAAFAAATQLMTAIGIGWGISWLTYASDYTRFTKPSLGAGKVFRATFLGMFLPTVWLAFLGAAIASAGAGSDPSKLIIAAFGVMALPVLLVLLHGPIATNIVVIYSAALSSLTLDLRLPRWIISGAIACAILYAFLQSGDFAHAFDNFMVALIVWISPGRASRSRISIWSGADGSMSQRCMRFRIAMVASTGQASSPSRSGWWRPGCFRWARLLPCKGRLHWRPGGSICPGSREWVSPAQAISCCIVHSDVRSRQATTYGLRMRRRSRPRPPRSRRFRHPRSAMGPCTADLAGRLAEDHAVAMSRPVRRTSVAPFG